MRKEFIEVAGSCMAPLFKMFAILLWLLLWFLSAMAQQPTNLPTYSGSTPVNFVRTFTATAPTTDAASLPNRPLTDVKEATQYFDGLGRPLQTVVKKGSIITTDLTNPDTDAATAKDLVTPVLYDEFGREVYQFLPFAANNAGGNTSQSDGLFKINPYAQQQQFLNTQYGSQGSDKNYGYSQTIFEASPLNRPLAQFAPGASWAGTATQTNEADRHSIKTSYWINTAIDDVKIWTVTDGPIGDGAGGGSGVQANVTVNSRTAHPPPYVASNSITFADGFESLPGDNFTASIVSGGGSGVPSDLITSTYTVTGAYLAGTLYKNVTTDEQGKQVIEFKDKEGKVVLKKVQLTAAADTGNGSGYANWMCTYYIYDDLGNLRCVIQPEGVKQLAANSWQLTASLLKEQCFRYEYDGRNRMVVKKVPGAGEVAMVYDVRDRLVMTQDGNLRGQGLWNFTGYDNLNRPVRTGLFNPQENNPNTHWTAAMALTGTTNEAISYPTTSMLTGTTALTETFYDNYDWVKKAEYGISDSATFKNFDGLHNSYLLAASNTSFPYAQQPVKDDRTKGLVTGTRTNVLGTNTYITAVTIYDSKARAIQVKVINQTNGRDITTTQYSWSGQPLVMISRQHKNDVSPLVITTVTRNTYDALGRVTQTVNNTINNTTSVQSGDKVMSRNYYDALGQLKTKGIGQLASTSAPVETQNYEYNIRGWLLGVNRNYVNSSGTGHSFGYDLAYDKVTNSSTNTALQGYAGLGLFNGNITGMTWRGSTGAKELRRYNYTYDAANRLIKADFGQYTGGSNYDKSAGVDYSSYMGNGNYADNNVNAYDLNGNILAMTQRGLYGSSSATIDQLTYVYKPGSNKLAKVTDGQTTDYQLGDFKNGTNTDDDYDYDINGNLTKDQNKGISSISYNILNLPQTITVANKGTISYLYDAAGNKLSKTVNETGQAAKTTQYVGGLIFEKDVLQHVGTEEGRVRLESGQWRYDYFLKDHLGNTRVVVNDAGTVLQQTDYYPFGLPIETYTAVPNNYLYQGKELQRELTQFDFGARFYDPQIGRWHVIDPASELGRRYSPYTFALNNPIRFIDPDGAWPYPIQIRSFAPFKQFGGWFSGDNRGFSASTKASSRLAQTFVMNTDNHSYSGLKTYSDPSHHPLLGIATATDDRGSISNFTYSNNKDGSTTTSWTSTMAGANPLVPGSPDIDVKTSFSLTENKSSGTLGVNVSQTGDAFPSAETLIGDTKGNQLLVGVSPAIGNPYTSLPGDGSKSMMTANFTVTMDKNGVFTGVVVGSGKDAKTYSVSDWNKMMQAKPAVQQVQTPKPGTLEYEMVR